MWRFGGMVSLFLLLIALPLYGAPEQHSSAAVAPGAVDRLQGEPGEVSVAPLARVERGRVAESQGSWWMAWGLPLLVVLLLWRWISRMPSRGMTGLGDAYLEGLGGTAEAKNQGQAAKTDKETTVKPS
ncbi:hypothetical protein Mmc1_0483 [Magnetococcus marinus MC-1]|uniref:Uncharacterized protein n=1 Tax=Magnetococcus marinus (strain ATCC BAA-1437 / JCM 17883 / MC-1) TaxID=156889 RepID=A0L4W5_MAGMM|nr:hypothetical protein [Magnetococcus marinus]ABK43008.1 hypothetical protein Mmc1_0483 [Magnetococcus marinus MC-1]